MEDILLNSSSLTSLSTGQQSKKMNLIFSPTSLTQQSLSSSGVALNLPVCRANDHVPERNCAHGDLCLLSLLYLDCSYSFWDSAIVIFAHSIYKQTMYV